MSANIRSKIYIIVSMTLFGTISIFVRNINLSSGEIALYRAILAFFVISCFFFHSSPMYMQLFLFFIYY